MKLADKLVLILGLLFVGSLYKAFWFSDGHGDFAQITVDEGEAQLISLADDQLLKIDGHVGVSELEVKDNKIRFISSPCPNQICVHAGWLEQGGEFAACLPNRIAVEVVANQTLFDAINF